MHCMAFRMHANLLWAQTRLLLCWLSSNGSILDAWSGTTWQ
jgi:hypothetical protein